MGSVLRRCAIFLEFMRRQKHWSIIVLMLTGRLKLMTAREWLSSWGVPWLWEQRRSLEGLQLWPFTERDSLLLF